MFNRFIPAAPGNQFEIWIDYKNKKIMGGFMYWQAVLKEVLNRNSEEPFLFTNLRPESGFIVRKKKWRI